MNHIGLERIPGYENRYLITLSGAVFRILNKKENGIALHKTQVTNSGYELVHLNKDGKRKACTVHRLVAISFIPNPNKLPDVNHKDGNKLNNHVENLEWTNKVDNMAHAHHNGLICRKGSKNGGAKLKEEDINTIRQRIKSGEVLKNIAKDYGVHYTIISNIKQNKIWTHVDKENIDYERGGE